MCSWERFQRNILSLLSVRFLESYTESIKGTSRSPGPKSEGGVQNKSICIMFVPWQGNKIGTIRNVHTRQVCVINKCQKLKSSGGVIGVGPDSSMESSVATTWSTSQKYAHNWFSGSNGM